MLKQHTLQEIENDVNNYWHSNMDSLIDRLEGKEQGHKVADYVDDKTSAHIYADYNAAFERNKNGEKKSRSMGDIWIKDNEIFHPVNIKSSVTGSNGQPNMVSMHKLVNNIIAHRIDSYYLLIVKLDQMKGKWETSIHFLDMLNMLDYITFDAGPGQIMLKATSFYNDLDVIKKRKNNDTTHQKVKKLYKIMLDGEERLVINRKRRLSVAKKNISAFLSESDFILDPANQATFYLE